MSKRANKHYNVCSMPDRGAGNDPETLGLAFHNTGEYGSNDLPRPRSSALSKCF